MTAARCRRVCVRASSTVRAMKLQFATGHRRLPLKDLFSGPFTFRATLLGRDCGAGTHGLALRLEPEDNDDDDNEDEEDEEDEDEDEDEEDADPDEIAYETGGAAYP